MSAAADSAQTLVDALSVAVGRSVLLDDETLVPIAYSRQWGEIDRVRSESIMGRGASPAVRELLLSQGIAQADGVVRTNGHPDIGMAARVCVPVRVGARTAAYIWLVDGDATLSDVDLARARATARLLADLLHGSAKPETTVETALVQLLSSPDSRDRERAVAEVHRRRLLSGGPVTMCLIAPDAASSRGEDTARRVARRLSVGCALVGRTPEGGVLLADLGDPVLRMLSTVEIASWVHSAAPIEVAVGESGVTSLSCLHEGSRRAVVALRVARSRAVGARFASWPAIGADRLVAQLPRDIAADVPARLTRLLSEQPDLARTLAVFLDAAGDIKATAAALSLHRSGVYYRLRRIEQLTNLRLNRGGDRLLAHLAIRSREMS